MTNRLLVALAFTLAWCLVTGFFGVANVAFGLLLGAAALWLVRDDRLPEGVRVRPWRALVLAGVFLVELLKSGWKVATMVVRPQPRHQGIVVGEGQGRKAGAHRAGRPIVGQILQIGRQTARVIVGAPAINRNQDQGVARGGRLRRHTGAGRQDKRSQTAKPQPPQSPHRQRLSHTCFHG